MLPKRLYLICILFVSCVATAQRIGRITGTVLDDSSQLLDHAKVCLLMRYRNDTAITCNLGLTDKNGQFEIKNLEKGTYEIFAAKEEDGYSIQNQQPGETIELTADHPEAAVTVRMRPRGAVLLGSVTDQFTGQPLKENAWISYEDVDGKASGSSIINSGQILQAVPIECDLVIIVSAKGYKGWVFTDPANPARPVLRLHSGERKTIHVQLEPAPEPPN